MKIGRDIVGKKVELLSYLRQRAAEALAEIRTQFGEKEHKDRAQAINKALGQEQERLLAQLRQVSGRQHWDKGLFLSATLLIAHCTNVVMLESRHGVWSYDYMSFSRRVGEMWEPFCAQCFEAPLNEDLQLFVPPTFEEVRERLSREIDSYIETLPLSPEQKASLRHYFGKVWNLVLSGEIKLALDMHFSLGQERYNVDFKSGFGSNEKGNTNRLLLEASIYRNIEHERYRCVMLVRSAEEQNNHYLQTLADSGLWEVFCGSEAYAQIARYTGFDLKSWIESNIDWRSDLTPEFYHDLSRLNLLGYLAW